MAKTCGEGMNMAISKLPSFRPVNSAHSQPQKREKLRLRIAFLAQMSFTNPLTAVFVQSETHT